MRKMRVIEHISLDGVIQAPGGPDEEPDYPYGGWAVPHHDEAVGEAIDAAQGERFDLLLGRPGKVFRAFVQPDAVAS